MQRQEFRHLISVEDARKLVDALNIPTRTKTVSLIRSYGSYLAEPIYSTVDVPAFSRASMDGYAVIASDTYAAREDEPVSLNLTGSIAAGDISTLDVTNGSAVDIATGAVMPAGANAVVMVEYTDIADESDESDEHTHSRHDCHNNSNSDTCSTCNTVLVKKAVSPNENIMHAGSDIMIGEMVLSEGTHLTSREIGVLAAVGLDEVAVRNMRVGIISTGNELVAPGTPLGTGKIYDSNSYAVAAAVEECGAEAVLYGIVSDSFESMRTSLIKASAECDLMLSSGGTSAGTSDILHKLIGTEGEILAHGINIKPGKPVVIARYNNTPIFGLPGYPTSALTIFNEFVAPKIKECLNPARRPIHSDAPQTSDAKDSQIRAVLSEGIRSDGRMSLQPVSLVRGKAYPVHKGSGAVTTLTDADGFIEIPADVEYLEAGSPVYVTPFGHVETPDLLFVGSNCIGLDALRKIMPVSMRVINAGSTGGISAIRHGRADIAGIHLLSEDGMYNIAYAKDIPDAVLIKGYVRDQGFIMRDDSYATAEDVLSDLRNLRLINRNAGSGTRILLDSMLKAKARTDGVDFATLCEDIAGYDSYARTHSAVASYVKLGKADVGVGIRSVATMHGLHFIDLRREEYDFLMRRDVLESDVGRCFLESLKSKEFADSLPEGLNVSAQTGEIVDL